MKHPYVNNHTGEIEWFYCLYCEDIGGAEPYTMCPICGRVSDFRGDPE